MRKKLFVLLLLFILPITVEAQEYCTVLSGSGKNLGDEVACGTEHFYVLENKDNKMRLFAKYNLYTGFIIDRVKLEKEEGDTRTNQEICQQVAADHGAQLKVDMYGETSSTHFYTSDEYCYFEKKIEVEKVVQSEEAKSAHWDEDLNYLYPQVGDVYVYSGIMSLPYPLADAHIIDTSVVYSDPSYHDFVISLDNQTSIGDHLLKYKNSMEQMGFEVLHMDLLSLNEINQIIKDTTNKELPLKEWGDAVKELPGLSHESRYTTYAVFGDLKPYILKDYSWLYSTTYWNKTVFNSTNTFRSHFYLFVAEQGKLCGAGYEYCAPSTELGCGIRPVVTVSNKLKYLIQTKTDGHGTIDVVDSSFGGEEITFKVNGEKDYQLKKLVITTNDSSKVEFKEGDTLKNPDGSVSLDKNKFTMPFSNVLIEEEWETESVVSIPEVLTNPQTGDKIFIVVFFLALSFYVIMLYSHKIRKKNEK